VVSSHFSPFKIGEAKMKVTTTDFRALAIFVLVICTVAGCATPSSPDGMTVTALATAASQVPPRLRSQIAVRDVVGGDETNPMLESNIDSSAFEAALEASLRNSGLGAPNRRAGLYQVAAMIERVDQPVVALDMTVTTTVYYSLIERSSNKSVWSQTVTRSYTARMADAFLGSKRLRMANEGSAKANIQAFLEELIKKFSQSAD
jgi:hypothetical protein